MSTVPVGGFKALNTLHCITGSIRNIFEFNQYPISEEMLLGLGAGIGFVYWHTKGSLPFMGGRANVGRPGEEGLETTVCRCTGVKLSSVTTSSAHKAQNALLTLLANGQPVMLYVDMGMLPYFHLPEDYHFGGHSVVAAGYKSDLKVVLVADRDGNLHPVPLDVLAKARSSKYPPFPPKNRWLTFDFGMAHTIYASDVQESIRQVVRGMLHPPIANLGVRGIRTAAARVQEWQDAMTAQELRDTCRNAAIMIDYVGGTGGGLFRYMYGLFLSEASTMTGDERLAEVGEAICDIGDYWQEVSYLLDSTVSVGNPDSLLRDVSVLLQTIADMEQAAWGHLQGIVKLETQFQV